MTRETIKEREKKTDGQRISATPINKHHSVDQSLSTSLLRAVASGLLKGPSPSIINGLSPSPGL